MISSFQVVGMQFIRKYENSSQCQRSHIAKIYTYSVHYTIHIPTRLHQFLINSFSVIAWTVRHT